MHSRISHLVAQAWFHRQAAANPLDQIRKHQLLPKSIMRKLPAIGATENTPDPIVHLRLFSPYMRKGVWLITEVDPATMEGFGWADLGMGELGYIDLNELARMNRGGLPIVERDLYFKSKPLSRAKAEN